MLVKELIEQLSKLDPELPVVYVNEGSGLADGNMLVSGASQMEMETWDGKLVTIAYLDSLEGF